MKIVVINGSPRKGITYETMQIAMEEMRKQGEVEFVDFNLPQDLPEFCKGCFQCIMNTEERCPDAAHVQPIVQALLSCDGMIIGTPVYALQISAGLKSLFDHMAYCYLNHRPRFFRQKALVITTAAGSGIKNCNRYIKENLTFWGVNKVYTYGQPVLAAKWSEVPPESKQKLVRNTQRVSKLFYEDLASQRLHNPTFIQSVMFNASRVLAKFANESSADKRYWIEQGFIKDDCRYYLNDTRVPVMHRIAGWLTSMMFTRMLRKSNEAREAESSGK